MLYRATDKAGNVETGNDERAVQQLTAFVTLAKDGGLVTDADVRDTLARDADAMITRLGGTANKAGLRAIGGPPPRGPDPHQARAVGRTEHPR